MKKILFLILIFSSSIFSFPDLNTFDKTKLIWKNPKIFYVHQYLLDVAFGRVNNYLCLINNTDYENNSNLEVKKKTFIQKKNFLFLLMSYFHVEILLREKNFLN